MGVSTHTRVEVWATLLWSLVKRWSFARANAIAVSGEIWKTAREHLSEPDIAVAALFAGALSWLGEERARRFKALIAPLLAARTRWLRLR